MKIICVDDEHISLQMFQHSIAKVLGVEFLGGFDNSVDACEFVKNNKVELAFLDIEMPDMVGIELAKRIHAIDENVKIVFLTGYDKYALQAFGVDAIGYIMKPYSIEDLEKQVKKANRIKNPSNEQIFIRTMPRFDVFIDGVALKFERQKSKELLALLINMQGGSVNQDYAVTFLWEDRPYDDTVKSMYRVVLASLRTTLNTAGCGEILINERNSRSADFNKFECDLVKLFAKDEETIKHYNGEYMCEYGWSEDTNMIIKKFIRGLKKE